MDLIKSGRYIDIFYAKTCATTKISTVVGYHVVLAIGTWNYGLSRKVGCLTQVATKTGYDTFILIVIVHPLPVSFWLLVDFVKDSLVDICWERADLLAFCLFCFTIWYLKIVPPPVPCPPPSPPSPLLLSEGHCLFVYFLLYWYCADWLGPPCSFTIFWRLQHKHV